MGHNRPPEREYDEPHHQELSFTLKAKRDLLGEVARMYAHGTASQQELEEIACEFADALEKKALAKLGAKR